MNKLKNKWLYLDDALGSDGAITSFSKRRSIGLSWENVSLTPRKLKKELDIEKPEIIKDEEIPPNDFTAEAVAKSLLQVFILYIFACNSLNFLLEKKPICIRLFEFWKKSGTCVA